MNSKQLIEEYLNTNGFEPLKDFEGKYMINREGKIWSIRNKRLLEGSIRKTGKVAVQLPVNNKYLNFYIQDLINIQYNNETNHKVNGNDLIDLLEFEPLKDFEDRYMINRQGQIWSICYNKVMKFDMSRDGYYKILLCNDKGKNNKRSLHRLLAIQYIPNPDNLPEVDHIDRDKTNNNLDNLRWVTHSHNCRNKDRSYNHQGTISECYYKHNDKKYYKAQYYIGDGTRKQRTSYDRQICEDWLTEMRTKYPRDNPV